MALGPSDVVAGRYELVRALGGRESGRVFLARDRHLSRQVVLRVVEPGHPEEAAALLDEGRMMASAQFDCLQAIPVLVDGALPDGGAYVVSELVEGVPLEEVVRRRAPLPLRDARRMALELIDAGLAVRSRERGRGDVVVASALVQPDGHLRVTRFARAGGPAPRGGDPAVGAVAEALDAMLAGGDLPARLDDTIADARAGRIASADDLRRRLLAGAAGEDLPAVPTPASPPTFAAWQWVVVGVMLLLVVAVVLLVLAL